MSEQKPGNLKPSDLGKELEEKLNNAVDTLMKESGKQVEDVSERKKFIENILKEGKSGIDHAIMVASVYQSKDRERAVTTERYVGR
jgi:ElaB/YqjD/DUF883 family membrane-anchored ribosome-binding protein